MKKRKKSSMPAVNYDTLVRMLAGLCRRTDFLNPDLVNGDEELAAWWSSVKEADAKRRAEEKEKKRQEKIRREALEKLTDEEKILLGIEMRNKKSKRPIYDDDSDEDEDDDDYDDEDEDDEDEGI